MSTADSIMPCNSLAVVIDKELGTTTSAICVFGSDLTGVADLALLLCAVSSKIINWENDLALSCISNGVSCLIGSMDLERFMFLPELDWLFKE